MHRRKWPPHTSQAAEGPAISSTKDISIDSIRSLRGASARADETAARPGVFSAAFRSCRLYLDWHPVQAGVCLLVLLAAGFTLGMGVFETVIPTAHGWALYTPLNGAALAVFLVSRRRLWPWITVGYLIALSQGQQIAGASHATGAVEIAGNLLEVLLAAFCLPPYRNLKQWLLEKRLLRAFTGYALLLGPALMALTVARRYTGDAAGGFVLASLPSGFWQRVWTVGVAEALGIALATPLVLVLLNRETYRLFRLRTLPMTLGFLALVSIGTWLAFTRNAYPFILLSLAVLVVIGFRQGLRAMVLGTALSAAIVCAVGIPGQASGLHGAGDAATTASPAAGQAVLMQSFLGIALLACLPLGVTLHKRADLEERVAAQTAELEKLKSLDRLTGVANRKRFDLVLTREWQRAMRDPKPVALLMVDVDYMEQYNRSYGLQAGDECLRQIATRMAEQPHRQYDLVSRFEGGRFSVILPGAPGDAVQRIAEEFRSMIAASDWAHAASPFERVTVSVGWASMMPEKGLDAATLVQAADGALAAAKRKGRNRVEAAGSNLLAMTPTPAKVTEPA